MLGNLVFGFSSRPRRLLLPLFVLLLFFNSGPAHAQYVIKLNDDVFVKVSGQLQLWGDAAQDAATKEYNQNLYVRRARIQLTGQLAKDVNFFIQTDNPNYGKSPKALGTGFILQDGWAEWKIRDEFAIDGGLMIVPLNRNELISTLSFITIDISPTANVFATPTQTNGTRDTGFQAKGYVADGRLEYRAGLFQGVRNNATATQVASHNAFLRALWLSYDVWEKERGYVYAGTNRGTRKVLAFSGGYNAQNDYKSYSASIHTTIPDAQKNEIAVLAQGVHYDGGKFLTSLPRQNDYLLEAAYYFNALRLQPFVKGEDQKFGVSSNPSKDQKRYGAGVNYYVHGQTLKWTGQITHVKPANSAIRSTNEFTVQMQVYLN
jgi:hypothetical protein